MRFKDIRQTLLKGIDTPDPDNVATPRFISPAASGLLAAQMAKKSVPQLVPSRRTHRKRRQRTRLKGVALTSIQMPWREQADAGKS